MAAENRHEETTPTLRIGTPTPNLMRADRKRNHVQVFRVSFNWARSSMFVVEGSVFCTRRESGQGRLELLGRKLGY
jgi:hypothetical protein